MTSLLHFFTGAWAQALGFTVLHSLWQALLIMVLVMGALRFISSKQSGVRYAVAGAGLLSIFVVSVCTFLYIISNTSRYAAAESTSFSVSFVATAADGTAMFSSALAALAAFIRSAIPAIVLMWSAGAAVFTLRFFGSWWYTTRLRSLAVPADSVWMARVQALADEINLQRVVSLAESAMVSAPVVIGYLKPVILLPVGMCAGLSTAQLESIFIHELIHIRRNDYLVNLLQSVIEALFFFNPFAWMISGILRQEREHCCDDAVVLHQGNALAYAHALAALEEARLTRTGVALGLAENKNQLLNRIKRIMEKSVQNYSPRERMIPVILLVVGLVCASWITVQTRTSNTPSQETPATVKADTTKKRNPRAEGLKKIATGRQEEMDIYIHHDTDEDHDFDHDEDWEDHDFDFDHDIDMALGNLHISIPPIPAMPAFEGFQAIPPIPAIDIAIPDLPSAPGVAFERDWEEFGEAFEAQFKERFGDFYEKNEAEMEKLMEDVENSVSKHQHFDEQWAEQAAHHAEMAAEQAEHHREQTEKMMNSDSWKKFNDDMKAFEQNMKQFEKRMHAFEDELRKELEKDGYISKDEKLNDIHWSNDGTITINGKAIKDSDLTKYRALHNKYFDHKD